jgi:hypothetical protein
MFVRNVFSKINNSTVNFVDYASEQNSKIYIINVSSRGLQGVAACKLPIIDEQKS